MGTSPLLEEIRGHVARHARPDLRTSIDGLLLSRVDDETPDYSLTVPLFGKLTTMPPGQ